MNPFLRMKTKITRRIGSRYILKYLTLFALSGFGWTIVLLARDITGFNAQPMFNLIPENGDQFEEVPFNTDVEAAAYIEEADLVIEERMHLSKNDTETLNLPQLMENHSQPTEPPFPDKPNPFPEDVNQRVIHVFLALDKKKLTGLPAFINSVLKFTKSSRVRFHALWCQDYSQMVKQYLGCFNIRGFKPDDIDFVEDVNLYMNAVFRNFLTISGKQQNLKRPKSCSELVALQAHRIFPYLDRLLWLDTDMIVQADLSEIWDATIGDHWLIYARNQNQYPSSLTYEHIIGHNQYASEILEKFNKRYKIPFVYNNEAFHNEVSLLNLKKWRSEDSYLQKEYSFWMRTALKSNNDYLNQTDMIGDPWWFNGGQAISWLTFQQKVAPLPFPGWHCDGLGWKLREEITYHKARNSKLLHWNGEKKPWVDQTSPHVHLYNIHVPQQCRGKGVCTLQGFRISQGKNATVYACPSYSIQNITKNQNVKSPKTPLDTISKTNERVSNGKVIAGSPNKKNDDNTANIKTDKHLKVNMNNGEILTDSATKLPKPPHSKSENQVISQTRIKQDVKKETV